MTVHIPSLWRRLGAAIIVLLVFCSGSCETGQSSGTRDTQTSFTPISADELHSQLSRFGERFSSSVSATASDIAWASGDRRVREWMLRWRMRTIPTMQTTIRVQDPRTALLEAWIICVQLRMYFESDATAALGEHQATALQTMIDLEEDIIEVATQLISPEEFADAETKVEEFAGRHPIRRDLATDLLAATDDAPSNAGLASILSIPIAGVSEGATAIDRLANTARVFTIIMEDMPQYLRWHSEMLLMEIDSLPAVAETQANFDRLSRGVEAIAETTSTLPADIRQELDELVTTIDESQGNLQTTVGEARQTVLAAQQTVADLDAALVNARGVVDSVNDATSGLTEAAVAWEATAVGMREFVEAIEAMSDDEGDPAADEEGGFDINDYADAGRDIYAATIELRGFLEDLESDELGSSLAARTESTMNSAVDQMDELINKMTVRALVVVAALIVGLMVYRIVVCRIVKVPA